jgi:hypothetical protein
MDKPLVLRTETAPTYFNKEAAVGLFIFPPVGALVGAYLGKKRMESEAVAGKVVGEPSAFNIDTLLGFLVGCSVGMVAASMIETVALAAVAPALLPVAALALVAVPVLGLIIGANAGKERMKCEYLQAEIQQAEEKIQTPAPTLQNQLNYSQDHAKKIEAQRELTALIQR